MALVTEKSKVLVDDLRKGMYVTELDRPWEETTFAFKGFLIKSNKQISRLKEYCEYVMVDSQRSMKTAMDEYQNEYARRPGSRRSGFGEGMSIERSKADEIDINKPDEAKGILGKGGYLADLPAKEITTRFSQELNSARQTYQRLKREMVRIFDAIDHNKPAVVVPLMGIVIELVASIQRNSNALEWLVVADSEDKSEAQHCMNVCVMSVKLGYQIGLEEKHLRQLALCGLLFDIGKVMITDDIRKKTSRLTDEEMQVMQKHVRAGHQMLEDIGGISETVLNVCLRHHERIDGNGYPENLKGEAIDLYSRIVAIMDTYSAITRANHHSMGFAPSKALDELYKLRDTAYDGELVEAFIKNNGMYPIGTLIETQEGEVGIVVSNDVKFKLSPSVLMVLDKNKQRIPSPKIKNFAKEKNSKGQPVHSVKKALNSGNFGIKPDDFFNA